MTGCRAYDSGAGFYAKDVADTATAKRSIIYMVGGKEQTETGEANPAGGSGARAAPTAAEKGDRSFVGFSFIESFQTYSEDNNAFTDSAQIGCILGFIVFFLGYLYTIVMIGVDMR